MKRLFLIMATAASLVCASSYAAGVPNNASVKSDKSEDAGQAVIEFKKTTHNFGTFPEENGRVQCQFVFVNKGTTDLILQKVRASCGCTTPDWTKTPVAPGDSGVVNATYNASGRPGAFTKTITVTSNAGEQRLTIKGEVIPKAKKVEDEYPFEAGNLRLKSQNIYLHKITHPSQKSEKLKIYNNGTEDAKIVVKNIPSYLTVNVMKEVLKPKEDGEILITYDSNKSQEWGAVTSSFTIGVDGKTESKQINVNATVVEDFSNLSEDQKKNAPSIQVGSVIPLGEIAAGSKKSFKFAVKNDGVNELIIRRVSCQDQNIELTKPKKGIKSKKSADIVFTIDTKDMKAGDFNKRITIISNDPNASQKVISVKGAIK
ncbi:MAG: DUF1573 domain-containing protein [Paludibacteraceae bacterium]|nr:DUF1573 domain-containing protein [Paludibacteraceae bacterium]